VIPISRIQRNTARSREVFLGRGGWFVERGVSGKPRRVEDGTVRWMRMRLEEQGEQGNGGNRGGVVRQVREGGTATVAAYPNRTSGQAASGVSSRSHLRQRWLGRPGLGATLDVELMKPGS